ncbi:MAG: DUF2238 domain-containing protein [Nanoarchaeota archaeon]
MKKDGLWHYWPLYCLAVMTGFAIAMGVSPHDRFDWMLENVLTVLFLILLLWSYKHFRLSNVSYTMITLFLMLHTVGSHYTYSEVPFGWWMASVIGVARNHYDRLVHFSFGLLLAYPIREVFFRITSARGFWGYYLPFDVTMSMSALYEIIEWIAAVTLNPSKGSAFLGSQGDEFDGIKDMAMAGLGALISMIATALIDWKIKPEFWKEFKDSFKVKYAAPLGEVTYEKYKNASKRKTT